MTTPHEQSTNDKNITTESDRAKIHRILSEFGLDPSDYIFHSSKEQTSDHPSAFSEYTPPIQTLTQSGRPISYVQQPPPPPPPPPPSIINRRASKSQSPNDMAGRQTSSRRTPPPPPSTSFPHYDLNTDDPNTSAEHYLRQIDSQDIPPVKVLKPSTGNVVYKKEIRIRYLQPPTPPPPAPIIIREKHLPPNPPESPLLIRERKPEAHTPPPLTIRERPPTPPPLLEPYIINKPLPPPPPQPRQIIIERLPTPPPKPRTVIFEKWLPYKKVKRPILLQKAPPVPPVRPTRNVVIEYEPLKAYTVRRVIEEGVFRVSPEEYSSYNARQSDGDVRMVDRIEDLPPPSDQILRVLQNYNRASSPDYSLVLSTNPARSFNVSNQQQEHVLSPGHSSSISSPTIVPLRTSRDSPQ